VPAQTFDSVLRALKKGDLAPVYYLVGEEDLLKTEVVRAISDRAVDAALRDFNFDQRTATSLDPEELATLLNTLPMMAERRVVVLRDVDGWQKRSRGKAELLRYLARPSPDTVLIMVQGAGDPDADSEIAPHALTVSCDPLPPERALRWINHRGEQLGVALAPEAAAHLLHVVGSQLTALDAELSKLASLPPGTAITRALVGELVGVRHGETIYDWRDAVFDDATPRALALLGPVLGQTGVSGVKLVTLLGTSAAGVSVARSLLDRGRRGGALDSEVFGAIRQARLYGLSEWKAEASKWSRWSAHWPISRLNAALRAILAADVALKSTTLSDESAILVELVLRLGASREARAA
jgi:DNA polymerase-3 subunit delta